MLDCCSTASSVTNLPDWLHPETDEFNLWDIVLRLYRCPSCGALWVWRSQSHGHQDWDQTFHRIGSSADFDRLLAVEQESKNQRLIALKIKYEQNGWKWKW